MAGAVVVVNPDADWKAGMLLHVMFVEFFYPKPQVRIQVGIVVAIEKNGKL